MNTPTIESLTRASNVRTWEVLVVDFGDTSDDTLLPSLTAYILRPGTPVVLRDNDGNRCEGRVSKVESGLTWVLPAWETWATAP